MAHIIGSSGVWKAVCKELSRIGVHPEKISDIPSLIKTAREEHESTSDKSTKEIDKQIIALKTQANNLEANFEEDVKEYRNKISKDIELAEIALQLLQDTPFLRRLLNYFKIRMTQEKIRQFRKQHENCPEVLQKKIDLARKSFEETQNNRDALIKSKCKTEKYKVDLLEHVCSSPEMAGASAELELIESLKTLPDNYYVVSDVMLKLDRAMHFDNGWLESAQIDHVVVCPAGIFVIEVKNWSKTFVEQGGYFDPYQQIKRASYLCYKLIGERYNLKARSIIAYKGAIPQKPNDSHAKVLPINEVKAYVLWFKEIVASDQTIQLVANWLSRQ